MGDIETVKVKHGNGDYAIINKSDFDPKTHKLFNQKGEGEASDRVAGGPGDDRNPSGTYSEPTPTDVRYPDKDATEFENNHGAFVGKSAAELRAEAGLPDAPGGIHPQVEIPADWNGLHWKKQVALAEQISGRDDIETAADAREIIEAEVKRRS